MRPLERESYFNLATFRKNGKQVATPVWFATLEGKHYVFTERASGKMKRLRNSDRARVAPCDFRGRLRGDWLDATARIVDEPQRIEEAYRALRSKYGLQMVLTDVLSSFSGRIYGRAIVEVEVQDAAEAK
jgi:PPOX class probable F420-dependent enzyme